MSKFHNHLTAATDQAHWYETTLCCPVDRSALTYQGTCLVSEHGRKYPIVDGVPVLLLQDVEQTIPLATASLERSRGTPCAIDSRCGDLHLESLGISEEEKEERLL